MTQRTPRKRRTIGDPEGKSRAKRKAANPAADLERQLKIEQALYKIADAASAVTDLLSFYKRLHEIIGTLMYAGNFFIATYDEQTGLISWPYQVAEVEPHHPTAPLADFHGLTSWVIRTGRVARHGWDLSNELLASGEISFPDVGAANEDGIGVPLKADGKTIGVVMVQCYTKGVEYTDQDEQVLVFVAQHIAVALTRARAMEETRQRNYELQIINSVQAALAAHLDIHGIYEAVGVKLREIFNYQDGAIYSADLKTHVMTIEYGFEKGRKIEQFAVPMNSLYEFIVAEDKYFVFNGDFPQFAAQFKDYQVPVGELPKSALVVPVPRKRDADLAVLLGMEDVDGRRIFSESDVRLLQTLANSMSVALENARLWEQEKMYRKALERELEIGRQIQAGFLPEELPAIPGWEIAASLMSAREVAGDFYDAFELPDGNVGIVIADVCDKGVGAALFMTLFRSLIRAVSNLDYFENLTATLPHSAIERLQRAIMLTNNYIAETHGKSGMFATLFFGILDPGTGRLFYINGGHELPFIFRCGNVKETLRKTGPAVGVITNPSFKIAETQLQAGDVFFAFTDGVPDCQNPLGEYFGRERLFSVFQKEKVSAHQLVKATEAELRQFINGGIQFDDITLLAVKRG